LSDITVRIRYFNILADYAGTKQANVQVPAGTTIRDMLKRLADLHREPFRSALLRGDDVNAYIRVFRQDRLVAAPDLSLPVFDGEEFLLFPAIAGGKEVRS
jgi:molybdopterin converting factor small subunit